LRYKYLANSVASKNKLQTVPSPSSMIVAMIGEASKAWMLPTMRLATPSRKSTARVAMENRMGIARKTIRANQRKSDTLRKDAYPDAIDQLLRSVELSFFKPRI
jgi:hypothetical protein